MILSRYKEEIPLIHFSTVFHLESVFEADLVSKDRDLCAQESAKSLVITLLEARWKTNITHNVSFFKTNTFEEQKQIQTVCVEKYCQQSAGVNRVRVAADCRPSVHLPPLESWAGGGQLI